MTWFTETAWPPMVFLAAVALVLIALWQQRKQGIYLAGVAVAIAACFAVYFVERQIVTDRERVEIAVLGITKAFQEGKAEETVGYISPQAPNLQALAVAGIGFFAVDDDMRVSDFRTRLTSRDSRATSIFRLNATIAIRGSDVRDFQPTRWQTTWQKEKDAWKLIKIQELDPITGEEIYRLDRYSLQKFGVGAN